MIALYSFHKNQSFKYKMNVHLHDFCWFMNLVYLVMFPCHLVSHVSVQRPSWRPCWISLKPQEMVKNRGKGNIFCHNFIYSGAILANEVSKFSTFHSSYFMTNPILIGQFWKVIWGQIRSKRSRRWKSAFIHYLSKDKQFFPKNQVDDCSNLKVFLEGLSNTVS